jgi:hypothetical protein
MKLKGNLFFYSETGTEGGSWAFQDEQFTGLVPPNEWRCTRCGRVWDKDRDDEEPKPSFTYWIDRDSLPEDKNPKRYIAGYHAFDEPQSGTLIDPATGVEFPVSDGPGELDRTFMYSINATANECHDKGHAEWEFMYPDGISSYEGLHVLNDGDELTVYDKDDPSHVVWQGTINLKHYDLFTEHVSGMWMHADQQGEDRDAWAQLFFENYPAELETK